MQRLTALSNNAGNDTFASMYTEAAIELQNKFNLYQDEASETTQFKRINALNKTKNELEKAVNVQNNETPKVESEFKLKGGPLQSEAQAREEWLKKTRNSPAQQSGAWAGKEEELWEQSKKSGANKGREFAEAIKKPEVKSEDLLNNMKKG